MIKLQGTDKVYENGKRALNDINLCLPQKGMMAIVGESGCGKSTLLNLLSNNDSPSKGELTYNDVVYQDIDRQILTRDFAYIYQDFKLIENMTVYQNIMIGHELTNSNIDQDSVIAVADELCIAELLDQKVYALSGGQMQRVAIARALVRSPKVIFADEPTGNLDSNNRENVYNTLRKLSCDILVVIVTHDVAIANWADRLITLVDGEVNSDVENNPLCEPTIKSDDRTQEDEDIDSIFRELNINNKVAKIRANCHFSYSKAKSIKRKKSGLSAKSTLGLSLALINKDIIKKVCMTVILLIFIGLMLLSSSMVFATPEKTMMNTMRRNNDSLFGISPIVGGSNYSVNNNDMKYIDSLFSSVNAKSYEIARGEVIAKNWGDVEPLLTDHTVQSAYYGLVNFEKMNNAIYTDSLNELGLDMLIGRSPVNSNEIAISQTYYEYMLYYTDFIVSIADDEYNLHFDKQTLLGRKLDPFNIVISGVFDDKNGLDMALKSVDITSLTDEEEMKKLENILVAEHKQNVLIDLIIKPVCSYGERASFAGVGSDYKISAENSLTAADKYFDYMPLNDTTDEYYGEANLNGIKLMQGEIIIDNRVLHYFNQYYGEDYQEGSTIRLSVCEMTKMMDYTFPRLVHDTKSFVIKKAVDFAAVSGTIIMNQADYSQWVYAEKYSINRLISGAISPKELLRINKEYDRYIEKVAGNYIEAYISYSIRNCPINSVEDLSFIDISNKYIAMPLLIVSVLIAIALIIIFYSDIVKTKTRDLLILKSLGANSIDLTKIYGIFSVVLLSLQIVIGSIVGGLLSSLFNIFGSSVSGFAKAFNIFYLDASSLSLSIFLIVSINAIALVVSLLAISNKNLRKAFQKTKQ